MHLLTRPASLISPSLRLIHAGEMRSLRPTHPARLCCLHGWLLLTIEEDRRDYQLRAGQYLALPARRLVVLEGCARYCITPMPTPSPAPIRHATTPQENHVQLEHSPR